MKKLVISCLLVFSSIISAMAAGHTVSTTKTDVTCFSACNGTATATITGGVGPFTYVWTGGGTTSTITGLCAGSFTITVTDNSDMSTATAMAVITQPPLLTVGMSGTSICAGSCTTLSPLASGGTPPYTFSWSGGLFGPTPSACPSSTTTYTVTVTDANACVATGSVTVTITAGPAITVASPTTCMGYTCTISAGGAVSYLWSTGSTAPAIAVTLVSGTSYTVTGTGSGGCTATAVSTVTVNPIPVVTVNSPTICSGNNATLAGGGATTYMWSTGMTVNPLIVSPVTSTSYTVTGTSLGCTNTAVSTVTVNPTPTVIVPANITVCDGVNVPAGIFSSSPAGATYSWTNTNPSIGLTASGVTSVPSFAATNIGSTPITATITVTPTYAGCVGVANSYTITVNPLDDASFTYPSATYCYSAPDPTPIITGVAPGIFSSTPPGLVFISTSTGQISISASTIGTYTITYTTAALCSNSYTFNLTIGPAMTATLPSSSTICFGTCDSIISTVIGGTAPYNYNWLPAGTSTTANPTVCPSSSTTYTMTVADANGCVATATTTVNVDGPIASNISSTNTTSCTACNGTVSSAPTGGSSPYVYLWSPIATTTSSYSGLCAGTYSLNITDMMGCIAIDSAMISAPPITSNYTMVPDSTSGFTYWGFDTSTGDSLSYIWYFGDGDSSFVRSPVHTYAAAGTYNVCLIASNPGGCFDVKCTSITVTGVAASCLSLFNISHDTASANPNAYTVYNLSYGSTLTYLWDFGDGATSTLQNPSHAYAGTGSYNLCLTVDNGAGCNQMYCDSLTWVDSLGHSSIPLTVTVIGVQAPTGIAEYSMHSEVSVFPNPFSDNTTFVIESGKMNEVYSFELTDVLGKKVKSINGISEKQFEISRNGLENGIYFYKIYSAESVAGIGKIIIQ
jgi:PKD repeat protein